MFIETLWVHFRSITQCSLLFYPIKNVCVCACARMHEREGGGNLY